MSVIEIKNLTKTYGQRRGVNDVSLAVEAGQIYGFLGPNGAGKSTTIRLLLGFLNADSGTAKILGKDCWTESREIKHQVGYVPGDVRLYPWLTAEKAFDIVGKIRGNDLRTEGRELANQFRLEPKLPVRKMSRGNRQKLSLIMALVHRPELLILDEPTSGLDPLVQDVLMNCLAEVAADGRTVFFSSHTLSEVESICQHVAVIKDGQIVVKETLQKLQSQAPRTIELELQNGHPADAVAIPQHVDVISKSQSKLKLSVTGNSVNVVQWASTLPLRDLSISPPRLEDLFRQYYQIAPTTDLQTKPTDQKRQTT
ncbi:MAG: ABC transporter ATP-binding protein [Fuerstiella sp.]